MWVLFKCGALICWINKYIIITGHLHFRCVLIIGIFNEMNFMASSKCTELDRMDLHALVDTKTKKLNELLVKALVNGEKGKRIENFDRKVDLTKLHHRLK